MVGLLVLVQGIGVRIPVRELCFQVYYEYMSKFVDQKWYEKAKNLERIQLIDFYSGDALIRKEKKEAFLSGEQPEVFLEYPSLADIDFRKKRETFRKFVYELKGEPNYYIRKAYTAWGREQLLMLELLEATYKKNDKQFFKVNKKLFGHPRKILFQQLVLQVDRFLQESAESTSSQVQESRKQVEVIFKKVKRGKEELFPNLQTYQEGSPIQAEAIVERFEQAFKEYKISNWNVVLDKELKNAFIHVNQDKREIVVPSSRSVNSVQLEALVRHEVGVHVMRRENADRANFGLFALGMDGYLKGDEGLSKFEEYKVNANAFLPSTEIYLCICLVHGLAGKKYSFKDLFDFVTHYTILRFHETDKALEKAQEHAWNRAVKLFRGTSGRSSGICFTKDLLYLEGYLGIQETVKKYPEEEKRFLLGKYDPGNKQHRKILDGLQIGT